MIPQGGILTDLNIRQAPPEARRYELFEPATGLRLMIHPSGHKSFRMRFRRPASIAPSKTGEGGEIIKLVLDRYAPRETQLATPPSIGCALTLRDARELAAVVTQQRNRGEDVYGIERAKRRSRLDPAKDAYTFREACLAAVAARKD